MVRIAARTPLMVRAAGDKCLPLGTGKVRDVRVEANKAPFQFSKIHCPYSKRVKALFDDLNAGYHVVELDTRPDGAKVQKILHEFTKQRTVPNIFIQGHHIGGCDAVTALLDKGKLVPPLK